MIEDTKNVIGLLFILTDGTNDLRRFEMLEQGENVAQLLAKTSDKIKEWSTQRGVKLTLKNVSLVKSIYVG